MNVVLNRAFAIVTILVVSIAVVLGFRVTGPPARARQTDFDRQRVSDLEQIALQIRGASTLDRESTSRDPETHRAYEYHRVDATHFKLCAVFDLETDRDSAEPERRGGWDHGAGKTCFAFAIGLSEPYGPLHAHT